MLSSLILIRLTLNLPGSASAVTSIMIFCSTERAVVLSFAPPLAESSYGLSVSSVIAVALNSICPEKLSIGLTTVLLISADAMI